MKKLLFLSFLILVTVTFGVQTKLRATNSTSLEVPFSKIELNITNKTDKSYFAFDYTDENGEARFHPSNKDFAPGTTIVLKPEIKKTTELHAGVILYSAKLLIQYNDYTFGPAYLFSNLVTAYYHKYMPDESAYDNQPAVIGYGVASAGDLISYSYTPKGEVAPLRLERNGEATLQDDVLIIPLAVV